MNLAERDASVRQVEEQASVDFFSRAAVLATALLPLYAVAVIPFTSSIGYAPLYLAVSMFYGPFVILVLLYLDARLRRHEAIPIPVALKIWSFVLLMLEFMGVILSMTKPIRWLQGLAVFAPMSTMIYVPWLYMTGILLLIGKLRFRR